MNGECKVNCILLFNIYIMYLILSQLCVNENVRRYSSKAPFTMNLFTKGWNFYIILTLKIMMMLILHDLLRMLVGGGGGRVLERDFIWKCLSSLTFICLGAFISIDEMIS